jgi:hypothetical protein
MATNGQIALTTGNGALPCWDGTHLFGKFKC